MSGQSIIGDVRAALREAGVATGNGPLEAQLIPANIGGNPWDFPSGPPSAIDVVVVLDTFKRTEIDGARILSGDKKILMEPGEVVPKVGDGLTIEGRAHRIEQVWPLAPAGVDLIYTLQARGV